MLDCLVVGAGQSGLTCAHQLAAAGFSYLVIDEHARLGQVWRNRPRSLQLFTSRRFCQLGELPMPGAPEGYPSALEFADYIEQFATSRDVNLRLACRVTALAWHDGAFAATLAGGDVVRARTVIDATGSNQRAHVPALSQSFNPAIVQLTAANYRDPRCVDSAGTVLVVGDGASGRQIAYELADTHKVVLSMGRQRKLVPNVVLGRDIFWWLTKVGVMYSPTGSLVARIIRQRDPIPANSVNNARLSARGVVLKPRTIGAAGNRATFSDGSEESITTVIWCGGYKEDMSWLALPQISISAEQVQHQRGKTAQPGYFLVGRKWLTCRASELVLGVANDAKMVIGYIAEHIGKSNVVLAATNRE